jgi:lipoprotein-releasing system permease protein
LFELKIALKYLIPKAKSLSTALISLLSVVVISLVVWLVLVFLSVTKGIEQNWLKKLTSLYAPLRLSPTEEYYQSYFYRVDSIAAASNYTLKTIGEKAMATASDPYNAEVDAEVPLYWPKPEKCDLVKGAMVELAQIPGLKFQDYEIGGALLKLEIHRDGHTSQLSQMTYLLTRPEANPHLHEIILAEEALGESDVLLPKSYRDSGVKIGDRGYLQYADVTQEQRIPIRAAGFYDPGPLSVGAKCLLVSPHITRLLSASHQTYTPDGSPTNGIFLWPQNLNKLPALQEQIALRLEAAGIGKYWKITSYENYEFAKDLLGQLRSDRMLFTLIAAIILFVACCNIISLLVLLVNDKKREIAILQSMGASPQSVAAIFAFCGATLGLLSCAIGSLLAILTLNNLDSLISLLSTLQGHAAFHPAFFGQSLPNQLSYDALLFVLIATPLLSLLAGLIPALKATRIRPSAVLRSE